MQPRLSDVEFAIGTVADPKAAEGIEGIVATFLEDEGLSVVAPARTLQEAGFVHCRGWARITLNVHSSLAAVGLTAAVASAFAVEGISANVVAAYFHDHLFVPWAQRDRAMAILATLEASVLHE